MKGERVEIPSVKTVKTNVELNSSRLKTVRRKNLDQEEKEEELEAPAVRSGAVFTQKLAFNLNSDCFQFFYTVEWWPAVPERTADIKMTRLSVVRSGVFRLPQLIAVKWV